MTRVKTCSQHHQQHEAAPDVRDSANGCTTALDVSQEPTSQLKRQSKVDHDSSKSDKLDQANVACLNALDYDTKESYLVEYVEHDTNKHILKKLHTLNIMTVNKRLKSGSKNT